MVYPITAFHESLNELHFQDKLILVRLTHYLVIDLVSGKTQVLPKNILIPKWEKVSGFFTHFDTDSQKEFWFFYIEGNVYTYLPKEERWTQTVQRLDLGSWGNLRFSYVPNSYILCTSPYKLLMVTGDGEVIGVHTMYPHAHFLHTALSGRYFYGLRESTLCLYDFTGVQGMTPPTLRNTLELKDCNGLAVLDDTLFIWTKDGKVYKVCKNLNQWDIFEMPHLVNCNLGSFQTNQNSLWFIKSCDVSGVIYRWTPSQQIQQQRINYNPIRIWVGSYFLVKRLERTTRGIQYYLYSND
jgi:hypothetical protein